MNVFILIVSSSLRSVYSLSGNGKNKYHYFGPLLASLIDGALPGKIFYPGAHPLPYPLCHRSWQKPWFPGVLKMEGLFHH